MGAPAPNATCSMASSAVPVERGDAGEDSDLATVEFAELREFRQKDGREDRSDSGSALEKGVFFSPNG